MGSHPYLCVICIRTHVLSHKKDEQILTEKFPNAKDSWKKILSQCFKKHFINHICTSIVLIPF
jgi:hypothetical protein